MISECRGENHPSLRENNRRSGCGRIKATDQKNPRNSRGKLRNCGKAECGAAGNSPIDQRQAHSDPQEQEALARPAIRESGE